MYRAGRIFGKVLIFFLITIMTACAPGKKNTYFTKKKQASHLSTTQVGRNKYYFSKDYQKKLYKTYKKKKK